MRKLFLLSLFTISGISINAQVPTNMEMLIRKVADRIISNTNYQFTDQNNQSYKSSKGLNKAAVLKVDSKYNKWMYVNGVMASGMVQMSEALNDKRYAQYADKNYRFVFDNLDYFVKRYESGDKKVEWRPVIKIGSLDDCGAMAAGLLDVYAKDPRPEFLAYLKTVGDYILNKQAKLPDGTLARNNPRVMTVWADDLYMSVPFLARMGKLTGEQKYIDFAIKQVELFNHYLFDPSTGLFFHAYYSDTQTNGVARWGRCNGWLALAQAALIDVLPIDHPKRQELIKLLLRQITGFSRFQDADGMWHQLLDKPDSYKESSITAMFTYAVAKAVNQGWINPRYITIAQNGWNALSKKVTEDGQIRDICIGTSIDEDINYYYSRPAALNDTHGLGPFLMAGSEMIKSGNKLRDISKRR